MFILYLTVTLALALSVYALRRTRLANLALMFFSLALCLTALEAYYRFLYEESDGFARLSRNFADRYYRYDAFGLRASNLPPSETKKNLIVIGDSHVFGAGLKTPAQRFSEKLATHYPDLHVINLGWSGWDTKTETAKLQEYLGNTHANIPLVVLTYFFNDIGEDVNAADRQRIVPSIRAVKATSLDRFFQRIGNHSRLVELFYYRAGYPRLVRDLLDQMQMFYDDPVVMARHLATLEEFRAVVEQRYHANLLVVILPFLHSEELLHKKEFYGRFEEKLSEHGFTFIDMQPVFAEHRTTQLWVSKFDPHTNPFANQLIADAIISFLGEHPEYLETKNSSVSPPN